MKSSPAIDRIEASVGVTMCADHIVIAPSTRLDIAATHALVGLAASAVQSGSLVLVDLDPRSASADLITCGPSGDRAGPVPAVGTDPVRVFGPGCIRFATAESLWTIDLARARLFQSEKPIDPHFVSSDRWTPIRALWISCTTVTALTGDGTYISCRTQWTSNEAATHSLC